MYCNEMVALIQETDKNLSRIVNAGDKDDLRNLAQLMVTDHHTLVQSKMQLVLYFIEELHKLNKKGYTDVRNQYAADLATRICNTIEEFERNLPYI